MRLALVHDDLMRRGGAERVCLNFHKAFPDAPIYTLAYNIQNTYPEFSKCKIHASWFSKIITSEKQMKYLFFPLGLIAMQQLDLTNYDVVLMSSTYCAKYVKISRDTLVICYCYTPFRLAWNPSSYTMYDNSTGLKKMVLNKIIKILKKYDYYYAQRVDKYIAMTDETARRLKKFYKLNDKITILNPSINTKKFYLSNKIEDYYLVVSRLEKYKKVDLVIKAFNQLGLRLKIVGRGIEKENLINIARSNIEFLEGIDDKELADLYSKCKAFIFPQHEDYGLTPLEANASGRPVIAYHRGGVETTMVPFNKEKPELPFTALFFNKHNIESLIQAVKMFVKLDPNSSYIRQHAKKFDDKIFIRVIKDFVLGKYNLFKEVN